MTGSLQSLPPHTPRPDPEKTSGKITADSVRNYSLFRNNPQPLPYWMPLRAVLYVTRAQLGVLGPRTPGK